MADAVNPVNLPPGMDLYAGYDDGNYDDWNAICTRFPGKTVLAITTNPADNEGDVIDVENGDASPSQAPQWIARRRLNHGGPIVYCSWSALTTVVAEFNSAHVPLPAFWVAGYPAPDGDAIPTVPGVNIVAHQWIDHGGWDESIVADFLPGIDPVVPIPNPPNPTSAPGELFAMLASDPAFAVRYLYRVCLKREVDATGFATGVNFLANGGTLNQLMSNLQDSPEGQAVIAAERKALGLP